MDGNGNHTLTSAGIVFSSGIEQEGSGTYTLTDSLCMERNEVLSYNLIAGKLVLNGNTMNVPVFESGTTTCPRTLDISNSLVRLNVDFITGNSLAQWVMQQKNLTLNASGSTLLFDNSGSKKNVNFLGGNQTYHTIKFLNPYPTVQFNNNNTIDSLSIFSNAYVIGTNTVNQYFSLFQGKIYTFKGGITQYFSSGCSVQMQPTGLCADFITLMTDNGNQAYFSCPSGTINSSNLICNSMVAKGGATWNVTNFVDLGNNAGWTFTAANRRTLYWVGDSGLWSQESNWSATSGGIGGECIPTIVDDVIFDANSFKTYNAVVELDMNDHNCHGMYWQNITNSPILRNQGNRLNCSGTLTFSQAMTVDFKSQFAILNLYGSDTDSVTLAGSQLVNINFHGRGDYYLMDDMVLQQGTAMGNLNYNHGGLYTQGHYLSMTNFNSPTTSDRRSNFSNSVVELSAPTNITPVSWNYGVGATSWDFTQTTMRVLSSGPVGFESEFTTAPVTYHKLEIP